jgi:DNA ligase-1
MKKFSALLERLYYEHSNLGKERLLIDYFRTTPDPDRGYALAIIADTLELPNFKRAMVLDLIRARTDPELFAMSYDYVGELSETVAHLWPGAADGQAQLPLLHQVVEKLRTTPKAELADYVVSLLDDMTSPERWALLKVGSGNLRIGVSARFIKQVLAKMGNKPIEEIESLWHGVELPYTSLFAWLEGSIETPETSERITFTPVMLAHPLEEKDFATITPDAYAAEWKYDGIRVQLVSNEKGKALFTRTGDDIGQAFPEVLERMNFHGTLDGELVVKREDAIGAFNELQQRLGRKSPTAKLIATYPTAIIAYDMLRLEHEDIRNLPYTERRRLLGLLLEEKKPEQMSLSPEVSFTSFDDLVAHRDSVASITAIEGLMLKRKDSAYITGRPTGPWYKWKTDPRLVDAVLMYAQRGSGRRSSYFSDYTFGLWRGEELLPIGKAYFGFTDEELKRIDKWVRHHVLQTFGPVAEVDKELVFEVAFDAVHRSKRHKSGFALRFPRIHRIRWDKPANEADKLDILEAMIN